MSGYDGDSGTAVVTGASRGLGRELALQLHASGYETVAVSRREASAPDSSRWSWLCCDLADGDQLEDALAALAGAPPDVLVCAAATAPQDGGGSAVAQTVAVNLTAPIRLCQTLAPAMARRGSGWIVLVSSAAAVRPIPGFAVYGASKAGLDAYAAALRAEVGPTGVGVLLVRPGRMATSFFADNGFAPEAVSRSKTYAEPSAVAAAIMRRIGHSGEYVHGRDRWLLRALPLLPRPAAAALWRRAT
jgi:short-subunit dehydrogenase